MRPVAFLQHDKTQRPGLISDYLHRIGVETRTFFPDDDEDVPLHARDFSGIVLLGSNRSVNEALGWIDDEIDLIHDALEADVPLLGHCFGAQMIAKSLGATVARTTCPNIGWTPLHVTPAAATLFRETDVMAFNWHYESFTMPARAQRLLIGDHCMNKAFSIGKHMAFQCHFEVTEDIVLEWCDEGSQELARASGPAAQGRSQIVDQLKSRLPMVHAAGMDVYRRWAADLVRPHVSHYAGGW